MEVTNPTLASLGTERGVGAPLHSVHAPGRSPGGFWTANNALIISLPAVWLCQI